MLRLLYSKIQRRTQSNGQYFNPGYQPLGQHRCYGIFELIAVACGTFTATLVLTLLGSRLLSTNFVSGEFVPNSKYVPFRTLSRARLTQLGQYRSIAQGYFTKTNVIRHRKSGLAIGTTWYLVRRGSLQSH